MAAHYKLHPLTGVTDHDITGLSLGQLLYVSGSTNGVQSTGVYANSTGALTATSISASSINANTISGTTLYSGSTNLYSIFITSGSLTPTYVQNGANTTTGGTQYLPTVNVVASPSFNGLTLSGTGAFAGVTATSVSATTITGTTIYSGGTNIYNLFQRINNNSVVSGGANITTGGTFYVQTVNVVASPSFNGLTLSGTGQFAGVTATSLSGGTISGGTFYSGTTNLFNIFQGLNSVVIPGANITTGGTFYAETISVAASPGFNGLTASGTSNFTGTLQSGGTDLNNIFVQGSGTNGTIPLWNGTRLQGNSILTQGVTGLTIGGSVYIYGNLEVLGTATTFDTQTIQSTDNNISLNYSGSHVSAYGGGISVLSGTVSNSPSTFTIDANGVWSANTGFQTSAITVNGGALISGATNLYSIFQGINTTSSPTNGVNIITGGTYLNPSINVVASPIFNGLTTTGATSLNTTTALTLSGGTISGGTLYSGSTNLYNIFITSGSVMSTLISGGTNIITGGTSTMPTISVVPSPSFNGLTASGNTSLQGTTGTTIQATTFFSMIAYTDSAPASPAANNIWFNSGATGIITLNYFIGGVTKAVELS